MQPDEIIRRTSDDAPFQPLSQAELSTKLQEEFPNEFKVHTTAHYLILYNTSRTYARWCGALFERLYGAYHNYWRRRDLPQQEPQFPLVALVFRDKASYVKYAKRDLGEAAGAAIGYYSLRTNRVAMYDLTGVGSSPLAPRSFAQIDAVLSRPQAERTVATVIHEATHQIAFNCGLHDRSADIPMWLSEGVAMYFESPDLKSKRGWRTIGAVNAYQLAQFRRYTAVRPEGVLKQLIADDRRFRRVQTVTGAYAESWALTYFLLRTREEQMVAYLKLLSQKKPLVKDDQATRLEDFTKHFGDIDELEQKFLRYMEEVKP